MLREGKKFSVVETVSKGKEAGNAVRERKSWADRKASKDMLKILDYILFAIRSYWKVLSRKVKCKDL